MKKSTGVILLGITTFLMVMGAFILEFNSSLWWGVTAFTSITTIIYWSVPSREQRLKKAHKKNWKEKQRISN